MTDKLQDSSGLNRFAIVPEPLLYHSKLSSNALRVYLTLVRHAREKATCFPGQATITRLLGLSRRSVYSCLQELKDLQLITIEAHTEGKYKTRNTYHLLPLNEQNLPTALEKRPAKITHSSGQNLPTKDTQSKETGTPLSPTVSAKPFTDWWMLSFPEHFTMPYSFAGAKDAKAARRLVTLFSLADLQHMTLIAWDHPDAWIRKQSRSIAGFSTIVNQLHSQPKKTYKKMFDPQYGDRWWVDGKWVSQKPKDCEAEELVKMQ